MLDGSFSDECLQTNRFLCLEDAKAKIGQWQREYNEFRPRNSLGNKTPGEFALDQGILNPAC